MALGGSLTFRFYDLPAGRLRNHFYRAAMRAPTRSDYRHDPQRITFLVPQTQREQTLTVGQLAPLVFVVEKLEPVRPLRLGKE